MAGKVDKLLGAYRDRDAGVASIVAGTNITVDATDPNNPVINATSGSSLAVQDIQKDQVSATTLYTGIAAKGTATSASTWTLLKHVLSGNDRTSRDVYTATDSWDNRASASYVLSNSYSY